MGVKGCIIFQFMYDAITFQNMDIIQSIILCSEHQSDTQELKCFLILQVQKPCLKQPLKKKTNIWF